MYSLDAMPIFKLLNVVPKRKRNELQEKKKVKNGMRLRPLQM